MPRDAAARRCCQLTGNPGGVIVDRSLRIVEPACGGLEIHLGQSPSPIARIEENTWESSFFGRRQAKASIDFEAVPADGTSILKQVVASLGSEADRLRYALTEIRIDARNLGSFAMLQDAGFRLVESRVGFQRRVERASVRKFSYPGGRIRLGTQADHETLLKLTRDGFACNDAFYSRFKNPSYFSQEQTERYYSAWVTHHLEVDDYYWAVLDVADRTVGYMLYTKIGAHESGAPRYSGVLSTVAPGSRGGNALTAIRSFIFNRIPEDLFYWESFSQLSNLSAITSQMHDGMRLSSVEHILYREGPV